MENVYGVMHSSMLKGANLELTMGSVDRTFNTLKAANGDAMYVDTVTEQVLFESKCGGKKSGFDDDDFDDDEDEEDCDDEDC